MPLSKMLYVAVSKWYSQDLNLGNAGLLCLTSIPTTNLMHNEEIHDKYVLLKNMYIIYVGFIIYIICMMIQIKKLPETNEEGSNFQQIYWENDQV